MAGQLAPSRRMPDGLPGRVHVIGASGRSGRALCAALRVAGVRVTPVLRDPAKSPEGVAPARLADLRDAAALARALGDAECVACCAHARHAGAVLAAAPNAARFVFLGSTRRCTRWPDAHGNGVLAGEAAFLASGRNGAMLHPTMIYGAEGEDNVRRLAALLARAPGPLRIAPLPAGGRALVQPIHQDDVTAALLAALRRDWRGPRALTIAGPAPLPYAAFVKAVCRAAGLPPPRIMPAPAWMLMAASLLTRLPGLPRIRPEEIRRLSEHKAFDIEPMRRELGLKPMGLEAGLSRTFPESVGTAPRA